MFLCIDIIDTCSSFLSCSSFPRSQRRQAISEEADRNVGTSTKAIAILCQASYTPCRQPQPQRDFLGCYTYHFFTYWKKIKNEC